MSVDTPPNKPEGPTRDANVGKPSPLIALGPGQQDPVVGPEAHVASEAGALQPVRQARKCGKRMARRKLGYQAKKL